MTRYTLDTTGDEERDNPKAFMREDPEGAWVPYEDMGLPREEDTEYGDMILVYREWHERMLALDAARPVRRVSMPQARGATGPRGLGAGHPPLFGFEPALVFDAHPDGGGYPIGFLERAYKTLLVADPTKVLHLCSGSVRIGTTVDIRPEMRPDIVSDCRSVPLPSESFDWIMADPPYSEDYATNLYGTGADYPKPGQILREAARLLRPGGRVGLLHFQVPMHRPPLRMVGVWGISTGAGYAIRAWTVFEKDQRGLWPALDGRREEGA